MTIMITCEICGEKAAAKSRKKKYCDACAAEAHRISNCERKHTARYKKLSSNDNMKNISRISLEASRAGMSYGAYVAKMGL